MHMLSPTVRQLQYRPEDYVLAAYASKHSHKLICYVCVAREGQLKNLTIGSATESVTSLLVAQCPSTNCSMA
jgi:hypothetical protein